MGFQKQQQIILLITFLTIALSTLKPASADDFIKKSCKASTYPDLCYASLSQFASQVKNSSEKLALVSMTYSLSKVQLVKAHVQELSQKAKDPNLLQSLEECIEEFDTTMNAIKESIDQFKDIKAPGAISNVQAYMSGALGAEYSCVDTMEETPDGPEKNDVVNQTNGIEKITSISLEMFDLFAKS